MKATTAASLIVLALAGSSCGGRQAVEIDPSTVPVQNRWNGTIGSPPELAGVSSIRGSGWMGPQEKNADRTEAEVSVSNAVPGGKHPWHVHRGRCGADQGIFGPADAYKPLEVNNDGRATSRAELAVATPRTGEFFINVHASRQNMSTIVACGNLAPPTR
jgi:hypothetical protein